ncbi:MAG: hypothetical protein EA385_16810 [Salinarimonadaceae bacterium]|nr:MAG: hypothetical protein EA385_16810 [Salinarimonadaceae bacterium]
MPPTLAREAMGDGRAGLLEQRGKPRAGVSRATPRQGDDEIVKIERVGRRRPTGSGRARLHAARRPAMIAA